MTANWSFPIKSTSRLSILMVLTRTIIFIIRIIIPNTLNIFRTPGAVDGSLQRKQVDLILKLKNNHNLFPLTQKKIRRLIMLLQIMWFFYEKLSNYWFTSKQVIVLTGRNFHLFNVCFLKQWVRVPFNKMVSH